MISLWENSFRLKGDVLHLLLSVDNNYLYLSLTNLGLAILDISNIKKPVLISTLFKYRYALDVCLDKTGTVLF